MRVVTFGRQDARPPPARIGERSVSRRRTRPRVLDRRTGLHTGEIELRGDDITGLAVNIAARVADRALPGQVLVTRTVKDLVVGSGLQFVEQGEHELKGVPEPWNLYAVSPK